VMSYNVLEITVSPLLAVVRELLFKNPELFKAFEYP